MTSTETMLVQGPEGIQSSKRQNSACQQCSRMCCQGVSVECMQQTSLLALLEPTTELVSKPIYQRM